MSPAVPGGCQHDCPDTCAWRVHVEHGRAVRLEADRAHPFTNGALCPKTHDYLDRVYSEERVLQPLRRVGPAGSGRFEEIGWDRALAEIAARLDAIVERHGPTAILPFSHQGSMGILQERSLDRRFFARLGATRLRRNFCGYVAAAGIDATIGPRTPMLPEQIVHSRFIVIWGTDTVVRNLHLWRFVEQAREAGAVVVAIDPLRTETAKRADWHLRPLPGSDAALALGLVNVIVAEGLADSGYLARHAVGLEGLIERAEPFEPAVVERMTGIDAGEVVELARAYARSQTPAIRLMLGLEKHARGAATAQVIACLPALVGAYGQLGGGILHLTNRLHAEALNLAAVTMPELEDPSLRAVDWGRLGAALDGGLTDPPIAALIVYNANPATTMPNQRRLLAGLRRPDLFLVVHEQVMTETAQLADFVLPATTMVEHWDLLRSWGQDYLTLNQPAIEPRGAAVSVPELFRRLAAALGLDEDYLRTPDLELIETALDSDHPWLEGISFSRLREAGWARLRIDPDWRPFAAGEFGTASGKCELSPPGWGDLYPAAGGAPGDEEHPLALIATKLNPRLFNSTYGERPPGARGPEPALAISPRDAAARGIGDGDLVRVRNQRGALEVPAAVGELVRQGVVALPHGFWRSRAGGFSANLLTSDGLTDTGGGADFYDTRVEVEAATAKNA